MMLARVMLFAFVVAAPAAGLMWAYPMWRAAMIIAPVVEGRAPKPEEALDEAERSFLGGFCTRAAGKEYAAATAFADSVGWLFGNGLLDVAEITDEDLEQVRGWSTLFLAGASWFREHEAAWSRELADRSLGERRAVDAECQRRAAEALQAEVLAMPAIRDFIIARRGQPEQVVGEAGGATETEAVVREGSSSSAGVAAEATSAEATAWEQWRQHCEQFFSGGGYNPYAAGPYTPAAAPSPSPSPAPAQPADSDQATVTVTAAAPEGGDEDANGEPPSAHSPSPRLNPHAAAFHPRQQQQPAAPSALAPVVGCQSSWAQEEALPAPAPAPPSWAPQPQQQQQQQQQQWLLAPQPPAVYPSGGGTLLPQSGHHHAPLPPAVPVPVTILHMHVHVHGAPAAPTASAPPPPQPVAHQMAAYSPTPWPHVSSGADGGSGGGWGGAGSIANGWHAAGAASSAPAALLPSAQGPGVPPRSGHPSWWYPPSPAAAAAAAAAAPRPAGGTGGGGAVSSSSSAWPPLGASDSGRGKGSGGKGGPKGDGKGSANRGASGGGAGQGASPPASSAAAAAAAAAAAPRPAGGTGGGGAVSSSSSAAAGAGAGQGASPPASSAAAAAAAAAAAPRPAVAVAATAAAPALARPTTPPLLPALSHAWWFYRPALLSPPKPSPMHKLKKQQRCDPLWRREFEGRLDHIDGFDDRLLALTRCRRRQPPDRSAAAPPALSPPSSSPSSSSKPSPLAPTTSSSVTLPRAILRVLLAHCFAARQSTPDGGVPIEWWKAGGSGGALRHLDAMLSVCVLLVKDGAWLESDELCWQSFAKAVAVRWPSDKAAHAALRAAIDAADDAACILEQGQEAVVRALTDVVVLHRLGCEGATAVAQKTGGTVQVYQRAIERAQYLLAWATEPDVPPPWPLLAMARLPQAVFGKTAWWPLLARVARRALSA
jgi:hypothetical protein